MEHGCAVAMDALDVSHAEMREAKLLARDGKHDLSRVVVAGQDHVKGVVDPRRDAGKVAEQDSEARGPISKPFGPNVTSGVGLRIHADDLHPPSAEADLDALVLEQRDTFERADRSRVDPLGERVATVREVVVPEHDEARAEIPEERFEERHPGPSRDQVAGDADEIGTPLDDPGDGILDRAPAARRDAEMKVGQVRDPEAVELRRYSLELDLEDPAA